MEPRHRGLWPPWTRQPASQQRPEGHAPFAASGFRQEQRQPGGSQERMASGVPAGDEPPSQPLRALVRCHVHLTPATLQDSKPPPAPRRPAPGTSAGRARCSRSGACTRGDHQRKEAQSKFGVVHPCARSHIDQPSTSSKPIALRREHGLPPVTVRAALACLSTAFCTVLSSLAAAAASCLACLATRAWLCDAMLPDAPPAAHSGPPTPRSGLLP